ncbi:ATP-binding cassette domain-containing protein [Nesterenkonia pannonica]|uniref:ATP-binding cassette domain-containing protein n=1 Tax=Nesterenkonia pannonica TaxID=1548602 RepID=UPI00216460EF|nr:ATP-binding cassette domain-containing protein [Nesterenkonia pannonica]
MTGRSANIGTVPSASTREVPDSAAHSGAASEQEPLLVVKDLVQEYATRGPGGVKTGTVHALSGVSFELYPGEALGIVGETGSGKSTLARAVINVEEPVSGTVEFRGRRMSGMSRKDLRAVRAEMQMVYQDPFGSLNPAGACLMSSPNPCWGIPICPSSSVGSASRSSWRSSASTPASTAIADP